MGENPNELVSSILSTAGVSLKYTDSVVFGLTVLGLITSTLTGMWWIWTGTKLTWRTAKYACSDDAKDSSYIKVTGGTTSRSNDLVKVNDTEKRIEEVKAKLLPQGVSMTLEHGLVVSALEECTPSIAVKQPSVLLGGVGRRIINELEREDGFFDDANLNLNVGGLVISVSPDENLKTYHVRRLRLAYNQIASDSGYYDYWHHLDDLEKKEVTKAVNDKMTEIHEERNRVKREEFLLSLNKHSVLHYKNQA